MSNKKFVILGGGTAGWITALSIRKYFPSSKVSLIHSEQKKIIGVGEATTPQILNFLQSVDIDLFDFLKQTGGSIKHGISFENWHGDGEKYMHPFVEHIADFNIPGIFGTDCWDYYLKKLINDDLPFNEYLYQNKLAYENKIDLDKTTFALHFDTYKFGQYLENVAKSRDIDIIKDTLTDTIQDDNGYLKTLVLENRTIDCDFVFDCSGFHRALIGNVFKEEWISYKKYLPMKKAIPFWIEADEQVPPYTAAIAMKYGWMWKIPLQDRYGCGYVYDSDYIDENQAKMEAEEFLGREIEVRKIIDIDAGRYKNIWHKNCIAVGLAGNFIEPLESTSIWLQLALMHNLGHFLTTIDDLDEDRIKLFNEIIGKEVDEKMNFVHLHYLTERNDTDFWKDFEKNTETPAFLKEILPIINKGNISNYDILDVKCPSGFPLMSWLWISFGVRQLPKKINMTYYEDVQPDPQQYKNIIDTLVDLAPSHRQFLSSL